MGGVVGRKSDKAAGTLAGSCRESIPLVVGGLLLELSPIPSDKLVLSSPAASLARSSHLPRTTSKLFATRCEGTHFLGLAEEPDVPVVFVRIPMPDCELLRESEVPLPLEVVRSRRRVWYAKGPEDPDLELREALDGFEFEGSILWMVHQSLYAER